MKLIRTTPNEGGAYPAIQEGDFRRVPEGMAVWPEELPTREFYDCGGFATLTVEHEYRLALLELGLTGGDA